MRVTVHGAASVFVQSGSYQLYVNAMEQAGLGDLYLRFEALKKAWRRKASSIPRASANCRCCPK